MTAYYNEVDPYAAQWLRNLIAENLIAAGDVDERDIRDIKPSDLAGYTQCHFFAGIGGWSYALRLAGWPDDKPVWTGSCPCQPFSAAGQRKGTTDERHLWPEFRRLIAECSPTAIFGEQVASKDGRGWLAGVRTDLEALGYAVGAADLCAAGVGAPHIRQRLWWVADADSEGRRPGESAAVGSGCAETLPAGQAQSGRCGRAGRMGDSLQPGRESRNQPVDQSTCGAQPSGGLGFWSDYDLLPCTDGKARPVEPGTFPLAHGIPNRVGRLRAYGNAIVPQVAAEFITAYQEVAR